MFDFEKTLSKVTEPHQVALQWFAPHAGQQRPWPGSLPDGTLLASKAKGIYKPGWTKYALSVRESLGGPYTAISERVAAQASFGWGGEA